MEAKKFRKRVVRLCAPLISAITALERMEDVCPSSRLFGENSELYLRNIWEGSERFERQNHMTPLCDDIRRYALQMIVNRLRNPGVTPYRDVIEGKCPSSQAEIRAAMRKTERLPHPVSAAQGALQRLIEHDDAQSALGMEFDIESKWNQKTITVGLLSAARRFRTALPTIRAYYLFGLRGLFSVEQQEKWFQLVEELKCGHLFAPFQLQIAAPVLRCLPFPAPIVKICAEYDFRLPSREVFLASLVAAFDDEYRAYGGELIG